jgi:hypothetical protein
MSNRTGRAAGAGAIALLTLAGCSSNVSQVRTRGAADLACNISEVNVRLTERPYVGVTRYEATGCGEARSYECSARVYAIGLPLGERHCRRAGGPADAAVSPQRVVF